MSAMLFLRGGGVLRCASDVIQVRSRLNENWREIRWRILAGMSCDCDVGGLDR